MANSQGAANGGIVGPDNNVEIGRFTRFTSPGTFTSGGCTSVDLLVVAGGAGGSAGGGGAGGVRLISSHPIPTSSIPVTVGAGGNGVASTITGSSVTRGGGGGGSGQSSAGAGGAGGGGTATPGTGSSSNNGTANTGGGGAAFNGGSTPGVGNGGSGVVILRAPTASFSSATVTGSPTSSIDGSDTIHVFNATGSIRYNS